MSLQKNLSSHAAPSFSAIALLFAPLLSGNAQTPPPSPPAAQQASQAGSATNTAPTATTVNKEELRSKLTPEQFAVTCNAATEPPFKNAYWNNHASGIYVDVIDGEPLFASNHKFDSGSGWPSFFQPLSKTAITEKEDRTHSMVRIEVVSTKSGAHLGHLFPDGPRPSGMRYCINSASLRFIPVEELEKAGYGKFKSLFEGSQTSPASDKK